MPDPGELLTLAKDLAARAAAVQLEFLGAYGAVETKSSPTDPVTEIDRRCERLIVDGILAARPEDAIVGEEGTNREGRSGVRWIVDPLDGTVNYTYGIPAFGVSIAADVEGELAAAVVHDQCTTRFSPPRGTAAQR